MVSCSEAVHTGGEEFLCDLFCEPEPSGGILSIGDDKVNSHFASKARNPLSDDSPPRLSYYVPNKKYFQNIQYNTT